MELSSRLLDICQEFRAGDKSLGIIFKTTVRMNHIVKEVGQRLILGHAKIDVGKKRRTSKEDCECQVR